MNDRLVLALEGSTETCSAALLYLRAGVTPDRGFWEVAARRVHMDGQRQARALLRLVDDMLEETGRLPGDLRAVVVGTGPGTFTGVRITVATARALSLALGVPVLGVGSLGALAACAAASAVGAAERSPDVQTAPGVSELGASAGLLVPVVDARRGQVFYGLYRRGEAGSTGGDGRWSRTAGLGVCDRDALGAVIVAEMDDPSRTGSHLRAAGPREMAVVVGESNLVAAELPPGVERLIGDVGAEWLVRGQDRLEEPGWLPQGLRLSPWLEGILTGGSAADAWDGVVGAAGTPESVIPVYVRSPDADVHITKMRDPWADESGHG